jgi:orotidine-5'-phosphate decarboxylase
MNYNPIIVALDVPTKEKALCILQELKGHVSNIKIGPVLFTRCGPDIVREAQRMGMDVFLDLKLYDIPNTVASTVTAMCELGIKFFTVHISGGRDMLRAAVESLKDVKPRPNILGVTVLTSVAGADKEEIIELAKMAKETCLSGVISSPLEIKDIRNEVGKDFLIVTPGIRPSGSDTGDQKRIATPKSAISDGADYIVVGRPIIDAPKPVEVVKQILSEISSL